MQLHFLNFPQKLLNKTSLKNTIAFLKLFQNYQNISEKNVNNFGMPFSKTQTIYEILKILFEECGTICENPEEFS